MGVIISEDEQILQNKCMRKLETSKENNLSQHCQPTCRSQVTRWFNCTSSSQFSSYQKVASSQWYSYTYLCC